MNNKFGYSIDSNANGATDKKIKTTVHQQNNKHKFTNMFHKPFSIKFSETRPQFDGGIGGLKVVAPRCEKSRIFIAEFIAHVCKVCEQVTHFQFPYQLNQLESSKLKF